MNTAEPTAPPRDEPTPGPGRARRAWPGRLLIGLLLLAHVSLVFHCAVEDFATYDEIGHLTAGIDYLQTGSYRLYNVNPPLPKLLYCWPVLMTGPDTNALRLREDTPSTRPEWDVGDLFARDNAAHYHQLVILARAAALPWAVLAALGVYVWAKTLWGPEGGLLALAVWCFEPNVIAHAHLLNPDMAATAAGLWAAYLFRGYLLRPTWMGAALAGVVLGVAESCKFTLLLLYPIWCGLWLCFAGRYLLAGAGGPGLVARAGQMVLLVGVSLYVINLTYEFSGTGKQLKEFPFISESLAGPQEDWTLEENVSYGNRFNGTLLGEVPVPLPEDFVRGIDVQRRDFELYRTRYSYLRGEWKQNGWYYYYLYAAAVKVPLGTWALLLFALAWPLLDRSAPRLAWADLVILWAPALLIFAFVSSQTSLQHHLRYVLPVFPFAVVYLGRAAQACVGPRLWPKGFVAASLVTAIASYLAVHPHSLAYFNEAAGGPDKGHDHLLGSNIDWGQDLLRLKKWLDEHPEAESMRIAYFNHIDPRVLGIEFALPPLGLLGEVPEDPGAAQQFGPHPGYFAVSVRFVRGNQAAPPDGKGGYKFAPPHSLTYFHEFQPIAKAGYSIFIYHITPEEANEVRAQYGLPPLPIEEVAESSGP